MVVNVIKPSKILVVGPSWVGDAVMAQSLFMVLKAGNPGVHISVLSPAWCARVLARMPEVDSTIIMPVGHGALQIGIRKRLAREIREMAFDQAIILPGSLKSALIPWLAGIPRRTGFKGEQRWFLLNDMRRLDKLRLPLNVQRYVALGLDCEVESLSDFPRPALSVDHAQRAHLIRKFKLSKTKPILALCPGAEFGPTKRWPARYFADVAIFCLNQGKQVWLFGSEKESSSCIEINRLAGDGCVNLCGKTNLGEAIDLMSCASYVVANDSGLMHVAAALGCHVIALYGSTSDTFTPPLTDRCDRLGLELDCRPCFKRECPLVHMNCLNQLLPGLVTKLIR